MSESALTCTFFKKTGCGYSNWYCCGVCEHYKEKNMDNKTVKIKETVTTTRELNINLTGIKLLNVGEYNTCKEIIPNDNVYGGWWLSPSSDEDSKGFVPVVTANGELCSVMESSDHEVRPVILFEPCGIKLRARFRLFAYSWTVISPTMALCDCSLAKCSYENSQVENYIKNWFKESERAYA